MIPGLLVLSMGAGVLWADSGHRVPVFLLATWLLCVVVILGALLDRTYSRAKPSTQASDSGRGWIIVGMLAAAGLAFFAGFERLSVELARAERDTQLAHRALGEGLRLAEGVVVRRRSGRWGDEVELASVLAVDGEGRLPSRLRLRLGAPQTRSIDTPRSRADRLLWPGAWVRVGVHVSPDRSPRNPGTQDRAHRLARRGHAARARLVKPGWVLYLSKGSSGQTGLLDRVRSARRGWRRRVSERLEEEGPAGAIVGALAIGDRSGIQNETRDAFRRLGLSHLLAVSGLHVGFVAGLTGWLVLRAGAWLPRRGSRFELFDVALLGALCVAALYAWTTGAGVSVERATLLFGLFAICRLGLRSLTPTEALSWIAMAVLWIEPAALFDVGAQLSFGACATLILGGFWSSESSAEPERTRDPRLPEKIRVAGQRTFQASLAISLGTAPMLAQAGLPLALFAPVVNVIAIPWLGLLALPASLLAVALAGILPDTGFSALMLPAKMLDTGAVALAKGLPEISEQVWLPFPLLVLICAAGLLCIRWRRWSLGLGAWVGIALAGAAPLSLERPIKAPPRAVFFDVGQGDASLIQGREAVLLVDTGSGPPDGSGGRTLVRGLRALNVQTIDVLVVTHGDLDHRGGARRVLASFPVDELWLPSPGRRDESLVSLAEAAEQKGARVRWLAVDARGTDRGDLAIDVLWPPEASHAKTRSRNGNSLVLRVEMGGHAFLFAADIGVAVEEELIARPGPIDADVLKVGHHGSRSSSSSAFLEEVGASIAIVTAPCDSTRGLPSASALARLRRSGAALWWTGRDGAVIVSRAQEGRIQVSGWGTPRRCELSSGAGTER